MVKDGVRSKPQLRPTECPLDDGVRYGPETWREIHSVAFCHWDRWLLRLALAERGGLDAIERELRSRTANRRINRDAAEAMLAQVVDLRDRLVRLALTPERILDAEEQASGWLLKKAWKRVWHDGPNRRTDAMRNTPRRRLEARRASHCRRTPLRARWACADACSKRFRGKQKLLDERPLSTVHDTHMDEMDEPNEEAPPIAWDIRSAPSRALLRTCRPRALIIARALKASSRSTCFTSLRRAPFPAAAG
jgi:hypothetical protein